MALAIYKDFPSLRRLPTFSGRRVCLFPCSEAFYALYMHSLQPKDTRYLTLYMHSLQPILKIPDILRCCFGSKLIAHTAMQYFTFCRFGSMLYAAHWYLSHTALQSDTIGIHSSLHDCTSCSTRAMTVLLSSSPVRRTTILVLLHVAIRNLLMVQYHTSYHAYRRTAAGIWLHSHFY
jgi:hypothetical protein